MVGVHGAQPLHAQAFERAFDRGVGVRQAGHLVGRGELGVVIRRGDDVLRAGGRGVAVLENQQHRVVAVEQRALHAGQQPVVPEAAVAHDRQHAPLHHRRHTGAAGQAHAVAEDRVAEREWLKGGERVAANIARDVHRADVLLRQLEGREHGPLGAADAHARRPRGQRFAQFLHHGGAAVLVALQPGANRRWRVRGQVALQKLRQTTRHHLGRVLAGRRQHVLAVQRRLDVAAAQQSGQLLLDVLGLPFFHHQHGAFADAKVFQLDWHQRVGDVEHQQRNIRLAKRIGHAELLQRANQRVVQATLHHDAHIAVLAVKVFIEPMLGDVAPRRRNALVALELFMAKGHGRVREAPVVKRGRFVHQRMLGDGGRQVVFGHEAAAHMAGADAQLQHGGHVGRF